MRLLKAVPEAVLWLYRFSDGAVERLRTEARRQKIDPQRLIFGGKLPLGDHLARLRLADLALDTPRYNGGATTANALCAGVPVVAILGRHFVSRMSASHLATLGLNELIVADLDHYAQLAIRLARSPSALADVRRRLHEGLRASALLDTKGWVRHLEQAFEVVWQRHQTGEPPAPVTVRP
jgi:predicted O-linked N-acetylglucosamine transferase (SPINDLY family)